MSRCNRLLLVPLLRFTVKSPESKVASPEMLTDASRSFAILSSSQRGVKNEIYILHFYCSRFVSIWLKICCTRYFIELFLCALLTGYALMVMFCFIVAHHSNTENCRCFHLYRWNSVWFVVTSRYQIVGRMPC